MIYITGDTHGLIDVSKLDFFNRTYVSSDDVLIILGDVGITWDKKSLKDLIKIYDFLGLTIIFIDGNHENFTLLNSFPIVEKFNAKMHKISNHIYHVLRGEIMVINNKSFLCIGGARSIDRMYRKLNKSYWEEETISDEDVNNAINNLMKYNFSVDYILTHCADSKTIYDYFGYTSDLSTDRLKFIDKLVKYKKWYFGHYHKDKEINSKKICVYNKIFTLPFTLKPKKRLTSNVYSPDRWYYMNNNNDGYLFSNLNRKTKVQAKDLPEWYVFDYFFHQHAYISAKGVKDLFYVPFWHFNHFMKDDHMYISYSKKIKRKRINLSFEKYEYLNWDVCIRGSSIIYFIAACEKYSSINVDKIKEMINQKARWFNANYKEEYSYPLELPYEDNQYILSSKMWNRLIDEKGE